MNKVFPATLTTGEEYTGNQMFKGCGIQRWCPLCGCHATTSGGSVKFVMGMRQWVCKKHQKGGEASSAALDRIAANALREQGVCMTYHPKPPPTPRAADDEVVTFIDGLIRIGVTQRRVAQHLGIHYRTVSNIVNRKGAYSSVPKHQPTEGN